MTFTPTDEQQAIIDTICTAKSGSVITVNAIAGASKTSSLRLTAEKYKKLYPNSSFKYMLFGRMAYEEAKLDFGHNAQCSTLHQLAYHYMVRNGHMKLLTHSNYLSWRDIPKRIYQPFKRTHEGLTLIEEFCQSQLVDISKFFKERGVDYVMSKFVTSLFEAAFKGEMSCTHSMYLKCFHIQLVNKEIELDTVDVLAVDEVQDLSPIMLDVVKLYPANVKVLVGDPYQSIFSFLGCVNAFNYFSEAIRLNLTKSFRCTTELAKKIEHFAHRTFDKEFVFKGTDYPSQKIKTKAYLTRTNNALIRKMIELNKIGIPYKLSTKTKLNQMFEWPLALMRIKPGNVEKNPKFKPLQEAIDHWDPNTSSLTRVQYLIQEFPENLDIQAAAALNAQHDPEDIINAFNHAKEHQQSAAKLQLMTVHTSKGKFKNYIHKSLM